MQKAGLRLVKSGQWMGRMIEDMLDLAFGLEQTSRLGCQIVMTAALDGLVVRLPSSTRNAGG